MIRFADIQGSMPNASMHTASGQSMRQQSYSNTTAVGSETASFIRRLHPRDTAKNVSRDTGLNVRTVEKLLERKSVPSWTTTIALVLAYGPDFLSAVLPNAPAWLDRAVRAERQAALEAEQARIARELEALSR